MQNPAPPHPAGPPPPQPWTPPRPLPDSLHTQRLTLRFWEHSDAGAMLAGIDTDRGSFLPWLPAFRTDNRNTAECLYNIERFRRTREQTDPAPVDFVLGIFDRATGGVIGGTGFHRVKAATAEAEIGYWIGPGLRGRGLCTEAVRAMISWGFTPPPTGWGFRRITIVCGAGNAASRRVPEKLGLRQEFHCRGERWVEGVGYDDTLGWGVLASEWDLERQEIRGAPASQER